MEFKSNESQTTQFNSQLEQTVDGLYQKLDQLWFNTRNPFILKDEINKSSVDIQEINEKIRSIFLDKSRELLFDAISMDIEQFQALAEYPGKKFKFDIYHTENLNSEKTAQEGYEYKPTIGFRMSDEISPKGDPVGDILEVRFISKDNLSINEFTDTKKLIDLLEKPDEAFMRYSKIDNAGNITKSALLRISVDGVQLNEPVIQNQSMDELIEMTSVGEESDYIDFDLQLAGGMVGYINKLVQMKLVRSKSIKV